MRRQQEGRAQRFLSAVRDWDYLRKWLVLGALIGVVAGLAAVVFIFVLEQSSGLLLVGLGGYEAPLPVGEGNRLAAGEFTRPWAIPLVVGLGGLISGILVFRFAPEAERRRQCALTPRGRTMGRVGGDGAAQRAMPVAVRPPTPRRTLHPPPPSMVRGWGVRRVVVRWGRRWGSPQTARRG